MSTCSNDTSAAELAVGGEAAPVSALPVGRLGLGLALALVSAITFGSSGTFARTLLDTGWSPGAIVTGRIAGAAAILAVPTLIAMHGRWHAMPSQVWTVTGYGVLAVAGCQLAYFSAVERLSVGVALLLEYLAPVLLVGWAWMRTGRTPHRLTVAGSVASMVGLALVLDVTSGARIDAIGVGYGLLAAVGLAVFFLLSARGGDDALPPLAFAGLGLTIGAASLGVAALVGVLPMSANTADVVIAGHVAPWWVAMGELIVIAAVLAYVTGIAAARLLGSTLASFVGLSEVLFAVLIAWVLVGQSMGPAQLAGGLAILAGVIAVKWGEASPERTA